LRKSIGILPDPESFSYGIPSQLDKHVDAPLTEKEMEQLRDGVNTASTIWRSCMADEGKCGHGFAVGVGHRGRPRKDEENKKK
jgi:hypothetical protein